VEITRKKDRKKNGQVTRGGDLITSETGWGVGEDVLGRRVKQLEIPPLEQNARKKGGGRSLKWEKQPIKEKNRRPESQDGSKFDKSRSGELTLSRVTLREKRGTNNEKTILAGGKPLGGGPEAHVRVVSTKNASTGRRENLTLTSLTERTSATNREIRPIEGGKSSPR